MDSSGIAVALRGWQRMRELGGAVTLYHVAQQPSKVFEASGVGRIDVYKRQTWERAEKLISIAHPMFRDELIANAEKQGIWIKSNKR